MLQSKIGVNETKFFDIGWLAGLLDGEGCISVRPNGNSWAYEISIVNTSPLIIKKCKRILGQYRIKFFFGLPNRMLTNHPRWKPRWDIRIIRRDCILRFLTLLFPHLTAKKQRASILIKVLTSKSKRRHGLHYYTAYENKLLSQFRTLQRKPYVSKATLSQAIESKSSMEGATTRA